MAWILVGNCPFSIKLHETVMTIVAKSDPSAVFSRKLEGRLALITGASRGIGRAVALRFAEEGAQIIAVARTVGGLEELDDEIRSRNLPPPTLVPLDLRSFDAIDELGGIIFERFGRLDVLVGNAGILGPLTLLSQLEPKQWQEVIDVNLTANWRLLRSMDPLLRLSPAGRAIFVTSGAAAAPRAYWGPYAIAKAALEMMVGIYAKEVGHSNIKANLLDPGRIRTKMRQQAYPGEKIDLQPLPETIVGHFVQMAAADYDANGALVKAQD